MDAPQVVAQAHTAWIEEVERGYTHQVPAGEYSSCSLFSGALRGRVSNKGMAEVRMPGPRFGGSVMLRWYSRF